MNEKKVFILKTDCMQYPEPPFHPPVSFPELNNKKKDKSNRVYELVRKLLHDFGMDNQNYGTSAWNPFKELIKPGDKVVIKPNLVFHTHNNGKHGVEAMITHASILRPLIDYVLKASKNSAEITICDVPLQSACWKTIVEDNNYNYLVEYYKKKNIFIRLSDFRLRKVYCNKYGIIDKIVKLSGDASGNCAVDLGNNSCFMPIIKYSKKMTVTDYRPGTVGKHHNKKRNEYLIPRTILNCDVFINLPKMKTHMKAGVTLCLKNLIGINADKSWIAHHRHGGIRRGGDEFDTLPKRFFFEYRFINFAKRCKAGVFFLTRVFFPIRYVASFIRDKINGTSERKNTDNIYSKFKEKRRVTEGSWHKNDTLWRSIVDLNRILFFADSNGIMQNKKQRRYFAIVDGITGMDGNGPMQGSPKNSGCLVASYNPVACDYVTAILIGMDPEKIPSINECFNINKYSICDFKPEEIQVESNINLYKSIHTLPFAKSLKFLPPVNWQGHVELK